MRKHSCGHQHDLSGPIIDFRGVDFAYPGGTPVLHEMTFAIDHAQHVCVIGPNGGGKTTLLKLMLGLLEPDHGDISIFGTPPHRACRHVGYVPQHTVLRRGFPITVREVVLTGCVEQHLFGWHRPSCGADADAIMNELGIADLRERPLDQLSGGQRQRVLIARALVGSPALLLLDEPTANIDPDGARHVRDILSRLSRRLSIITVSHDLGYMTAELDTVLLVNRTVSEVDPAAVTAETIWQLHTQRDVSPTP